jgi:hypothetical protein
VEQQAKNGATILFLRNIDVYEMIVLKIVSERAYQETINE